MADAGRVTAHRTGKLVYPWTVWTDGTYHHAVHGRDFRDEVSLRASLINRAKRMREQAEGLADPKTETYVRCTKLKSPLYAGYSPLQTACVLVFKFLWPGNDEFNPYRWLCDASGLVPQDFDAAVYGLGLRWDKRKTPLQSIEHTPEAFTLHHQRDGDTMSETAEAEDAKPSEQGPTTVDGQGPDIPRYVSSASAPFTFGQLLDGSYSVGREDTGDLSG